MYFINFNNPYLIYYFTMSKNTSKKENLKIHKEKESGNKVASLWTYASVEKAAQVFSSFYRTEKENAPRVYFDEFKSSRGSKGVI